MWFRRRAPERPGLRDLRSAGTTPSSIWLDDTCGVIYLVCPGCGGDYELHWEQARSSGPTVMIVICKTCVRDMVPVPFVAEDA